MYKIIKIQRKIVNIRCTNPVFVEKFKFVKCTISKKFNEKLYTSDV